MVEGWEGYWWGRGFLFMVGRVMGERRVERLDGLFD